MRRIFERTAITQHTLTSIAKDATGGGPLDVSEGDGQKFQTGILRGVTFVCSSTDFDIHVGQKENFVLGGVDEVYKSEGINLKLQVDNLARAWISGDDPKTSNLYVVIHNNDSGNATDSVQIQMVNNIHRRFSK